MATARSLDALAACKEPRESAPTTTPLSTPIATPVATSALPLPRSVVPLRLDRPTLDAAATPPPRLLEQARLIRLARQRFHDRAGTTLSRVHLEVTETSWILTGRVTRYYHKQLAQEILRQLSPEREIFNFLMVLAKPVARPGRFI